MEGGKLSLMLASLLLQGIGLWILFLLDWRIFIGVFIFTWGNNIALKLTN